MEQSRGRKAHVVAYEGWNEMDERRVMRKEQVERKRGNVRWSTKQVEQ